MRRNHQLKCALLQFFYHHRKKDKKLCCILNSMEELEKMLECMCAKNGNSGENPRKFYKS